MTLFRRFAFHHRIFVLVGLFVAVTLAAMWFIIRPAYERQVIEDRITVVQQLQHFAIGSIDETFDRWISITQFLGWNLVQRPQDVAVLIRQQIAFDTTIVQLIVSSPDISEEFVATSSAHSSFVFEETDGAWIRSRRDSTLFTMLSTDSSRNRQIFGARKLVRMEGKIFYITLFADARHLLRELQNLPVGGTYSVQVGGDEGISFSNTPIPFPAEPESWKHVTFFSDHSAGGKEWKVLTSKFSSIPMYLLIGIPTDVILRPVKDIMTFSVIVVLVLTAAISLFGWMFSKQLSQPVTALVRDVERLKNLDFTHEVAVPQLREIAAIAETVESMRRVLERYQRINVEKIIFEEWKNKFFLMHSEDAICMTDTEDAIIFMNDAFVQMKQELDRFSTLSNLAQLFGHPLIERSKEHSRTERTDGFEIGFHQMEIAISYPEKEKKFARLNKVSINRNAERLGSLIIIHDLTNDRLMEKTRTEMINFIAHELKNPLNSVMGFASLIIDEDNLSREDELKFAGIIHQSSKTMNRLVNRFLDVQRLESGTVHYPKEQIDLVALAKFVCTSQKPQLDEKSLILSFNAEQGIPETTVSPDLMREAFVNLISNAIKYGDNGRTIDVEMKQHDGNIQFSVTDHGYGITAEDQQKLFSKFFRVTSNKKAAEQLGTGLGLAHVKEVMKFHRGDVTLESNDSIGCRFTLSIPIV